VPPRGTTPLYLVLPSDWSTLVQNSGSAKVFSEKKTQNGSAYMSQPAPQALPGTTTPSANTQARGWMFTLNNYSSVDVPKTIEQYKFVTWQAERGANNTPHLQGYVLFNAPKRFSAVKKIFPTAHWEPRNGTHEQAREYCNKEDTRTDGPWTLGDEPAPGARTDILSLKRAIDDGQSDLQIWEEQFPLMLKYFKGASIYKRLKSQVRKEKTFVVVISGPTGTGKSYQAHKNFPNVYPLSHPGNKGGQLWFDGYDAHTTLVIDEFYGWIPYDLLLRMLDAYPLNVPIKGGFVNFNPKYIVITSNKPPTDWYHFEKFSGGSAPLLRRLDLIIEKMTRDYYRVMKSPESPDALIEIQEDEIDFKRFVPNLS